MQIVTVNLPSVYIDAIAKLIDSGRVKESEIEKSLERVARLKQKIAGEVPWKKNQLTI